MEADRVEIRVFVILLSCKEMSLETLAEVGQTNDSINDGQDDEENRDDSKSGE